MEFASLFFEAGSHSISQFGRGLSYEVQAGLEFIFFMSHIQMLGLQMCTVRPGDVGIITVHRHALFHTASFVLSFVFVNQGLLFPKLKVTLNSSTSFLQQFRNDPPHPTYKMLRVKLRAYCVRMLPVTYIPKPEAAFLMQQLPCL